MNPGPNSRGNRNRGRGGGRGRGGFQSRNDNYYDDNYDTSYDQGGNQGGSSILSRLGPMANDPRVGSGGNQNYGGSPNQRGGRGGNQNNRGRSNYNVSRRDDYNQQHYDQNQNQNQNGMHRGGAAPSGSWRGGGQRGGGQRGGGRGGGRKNWTRQLVDEDIDMGQDVDIPPDAVVVEVTGHPPGTDNQLLRFLINKSRKRISWEPLDMRSDRGTYYVTVANKEVADALLRMNGYTFMGECILSIRSNAPIPPRGGGTLGGGNFGGPPRQGKPINNALRQFVEERWDEQSGYLNFDDLPQTSHSISTLITQLLLVAQSLYGSKLITISFARNNFWSAGPIAKLPEIFPDVRNLSLMENQIERVRAVAGMSKLRNLTELMLIGNPVQTDSDPHQYHRDVQHYFPNLQMLDQNPIGNPQPNAFGFGSAEPTLPVVPKGRFFDNDSSSQAAQDFLSQFFPLFDTNRAALMDYYDPQAAFSLAITPRYFGQSAWSHGLPAQRLTVGNQNIMQRFTALPATSHDLSQPQDFMTDAWQHKGSATYPVMLFVSVHGHFGEATGARYSFDRTFIVVPSQPGSRAQSVGLSYVITNDSLIIRENKTLFQP
ncbi:hypothetical protein BCR43DRAFT_487325 [Syncephalastrum racemosum]|uniref:NTF2 domain-containing protein n=1 Tax=Syncephalastrum racemosum TaxID=13706 RepID=A0A1X2HQW6_SYNRA|nr:hypothetical protein BCR43DRAFT_487325 [Syncephalastrum racemosum]